MPKDSQKSSITTNRPPAWLFSNNSTNPSATAESSTMAKKDKKIAKKVSAPAASVSTVVTTNTDIPPTQLMDLVETFLSDQGFDSAHREFKKHRADKGWKGQG